MKRSGRDVHVQITESTAKAKVTSIGEILVGSKTSKHQRYKVTTKNQHNFKASVNNIDNNLAKSFIQIAMETINSSKNDEIVSKHKDDIIDS